VFWESMGASQGGSGADGHLTANLSAYRDGFLAAAVALIAVLVARTVNDTDAAATMVRPQRSAERPACLAGSSEYRHPAAAMPRCPVVANAITSCGSDPRCRRASNRCSVFRGTPASSPAMAFSVGRPSCGQFVSFEELGVSCSASGAYVF
jgi:hypothetical protein